MQIIPINELFSIPNMLSLILVIYTCITMFAMLLFCINSTRLISRPISNLLAGYAAIETGNFNISVPETTSALEFSLLIKNFNKMASHLHRSIEQLYEYKLYSQKMELRQLQMQMTPHFLYNTYFILHRLIQQEDIEQASLLSSYLGSYFQYITRNARDMVPLSQEWEHAKNYLHIQAIRFTTRISFKINELPEKYQNFMVPRLILQPLLENALEHGLKNTYKNGELIMHFSEEKHRINIQVIDNGQQLSEAEIHELNKSIHSNNTKGMEITALHNIQKRLLLFYNSNAELQLFPNHPHGLRVHIAIPYNDAHPNTNFSFSKEDL